MNAPVDFKRKPNHQRPSGPRVERMKCGEYQVLGMPGLSDIFPTRRAAEERLRALLAKLPARRRPKARACLSCGQGFDSEGAHNRMCDRCRKAASQDDHAPFSFGAIHGRKRT